MQKSKSLLTKVITICLSVICCVALALFAVSCGDNTEYKVEDGHLYLIVKGEKTDLGQVVGPKGDKGDQGEKGEQGEQGVPGNNGENGKDGNGIAGAAVNEDGELVLTYTNGETAVIAFPGKVCEHDFKEYVLEEADCVNEGRKLSVCNDCGWAKLEVIPVGGHDYRVFKHYYEEDEEDKPENWIYNGTLTVDVRCEVCGDEHLGLDAEFEFVKVEPTHTKGGSVTVVAKFAVGEEEYEDTHTWTLATIGNHFYNGAEIEDREYTSAELQSIFGDNYNKFVNYQEFKCGDDGYAWFTCSECEKDVLLYVRDRHNYGAPVVTVNPGEETVNVKLTCQNEGCGKELPFNGIGERDDIKANCNTEGIERIAYSYEVYGETKKDYEVLRKNGKDNYVHIFGDDEIDVSEVYEKAELESKGITILANEMNCYPEDDERSIIGSAMFTCQLCEQPVGLKVRDDHKYELDKNDERYNDNPADGDIVLVFKCKVCDNDKLVPANEYNVATVYDDVDIKDVTLETESVAGNNCLHGTQTILVYTYNNLASGKEETERLLLGKLGKDNNLHELPEGAILNTSSEKVYSITELLNKVGVEKEEDLASVGITLAANERNCKVVGTGFFTCNLCNQLFSIKVRGDHDLILDDESNVHYDEEQGKVVGDLIVKCKLCGHVETLNYIPNITEAVASTCTEKGHTFGVAYTYDFDGPHTVTLIEVEELPLDIHRHSYGKDEVFKDFVVSPEKFYMMSEVKEIFGSDYTEAANEKSCTNAGYVLVKCSLCGNTYTLNVLGDHNYGEDLDAIPEFEYNDEDEGEFIHVSYAFICLDKGEELGHDVVGELDAKVSKDEPTNKVAGRLYIKFVVVLNNVPREFEYNLKDLPAEPEVHHQGEFEFNENDYYSLYELDQSGVEYRTFANDAKHVAILCDDEDCGEVLVKVDLGD